MSIKVILPASINNIYSKRKEKYSYFKDNNLKNEKIKKNSFKYISNDIIKRAIEQSIKNYKSSKF